MTKFIAIAILIWSISSCSKNNSTEQIAEPEKKSSSANGSKFRLIVNNNVIVGHEGNITSLTIPSKLKEKNIQAIADGALSKNGSLQSVALPPTLELIGRGAFSECESLKSISIPSNVRSIGKAPFAACGSLKEIKVSPDNSKFSDIDGVLFDKKFETLIQVPAGKSGNYIIVDTVNLIDESAFAECIGLESIVIPDTVTKISKTAFAGCKGIKEIKLPNSLKSISQGTFLGCSNLRQITIPESVTAIEDGAFAHCSNLVSVTFNGSPPLTGTAVFTDSEPTIYAPANKGWSESYLDLKTVIINN
ncbi:MAG: leucine-rich repeat domain-containing protein [Verrucomicrobiales bacterium]